MNADQAVELARSAVILTLMLSVPVMAVAMLAGLTISIMQAVTQVQDQTLSFVPKIVLMLLTMLIIMPWAISQIVHYSTELILDIPSTF